MSFPLISNSEPSQCSELVEPPTKKSVPSALKRGLSLPVTAAVNDVWSPHHMFPLWSIVKVLAEGISPAFEAPAGCGITIEDVITSPALMSDAVMVPAKISVLVIAPALICDA